MRYRDYGLPMVYIVSEGNVGLMIAVKRFDPQKGFRLATYAMWWITATIQEYILRTWSLVELGTSPAQKKLFFKLAVPRRRYPPSKTATCVPSTLNGSLTAWAWSNARSSTWTGAFAATFP
jgi:RNA polymerase sigma-32 factor